MTIETIAGPNSDIDSAVSTASDRAGVEGHAGNKFEWQRFWIRLQQTPWSSLAVVPIDVGIDVHDVVAGLVDAAHQAGVSAVSSLDAAGLPAARANEMVRTLQAANREKNQVVVVCDALSENPSTLAIARAVSGVLLVARLGESRISAAKASVDAIGRERLIASISLHAGR